MTQAGTVYMWDFGGERPIPLNLMEHQCRMALKWFEAGLIEGMIFHCTPLCSMNIAAVEWARRWIAAHGDREFGGRGEQNH